MAKILSFDDGREAEDLRLMLGQDLDVNNDEEVNRRFRELLDWKLGTGTYDELLDLGKSESEGGRNFYPLKIVE